MKRKLSLGFIIAFIFALSSSLFAAPVPPAKGQWAFPLKKYSLLYTKADRGASNREIEMPQKWISVPSAVRDDNNYLWYSVNINGHKGWLPQNGIRLKMAGEGKSKAASNLYKSYEKARRREKRHEEYFQTSDPKTCRLFLGVNLIGMYQSELRNKLGTPTMRESPYDNINVSILSYELSDRDMTLAVTLVRDENEYEGKVKSVELYQGRTGSKD